MSISFLGFKGKVNLYGKLLAPVIEALNSPGIETAEAVYRAGRVLANVGSWLMQREVTREESKRLKDIARLGAAVDALTIVEMVLSNDTGSPFPVVDVDEDLQ